GEAGETAGAGGEGAASDRLAQNVQRNVLLYHEKRSIDRLFGAFPGAHGLSEVVDGSGEPTAAYVPQKDRDGTTTLPTLPKTWNGVTASGNPTQIPEALTGGLAHKPCASVTGGREHKAGRRRDGGRRELRRTAHDHRRDARHGAPLFREPDGNQRR